MKTIDNAVQKDTEAAKRASSSDMLGQGFGYKTRHFEDFVKASTGGKTRRQRKERKQKKTRRQRQNRKQSKKTYK